MIKNTYKAPKGYNQINLRLSCKIMFLHHQKVPTIAAAACLLCANIKKTWFLHTHRNQFSYILINNSRSKQNKKNLKHLFASTGTQEACAKFCTVLKLWQLELVKVFNFLDKTPRFLKNNRALPNVPMGFWINSLSASVAHIEISQLICTANHLTGFYMRATLILNRLINQHYQI